MNRRPTTLVLAPLTAVACLLPLAACSGDDAPSPATVTVTVPADGDADATDAPDDGTTTPGSEPTDVVTVAPEDAGPLPDAGPDDDAPFVANTDPDTGAMSSGALLQPTDLRFGRHDGYDRLVLDLEGSGAPGWRVEYSGHPTGQASGLDVDVAGDATLVMHVQGIMLPGEVEGQPEYLGPSGIVPPAGGAIREVRYAGIFEGTLEIFVGVTSEEPFRVYLLESPTRLVLDVQHP